MPHARWRNFLEITTNIAVLVMAVVVSAALLRNHFAEPPKPQFQAGFQKG